MKDILPYLKCFEAAARYKNFTRAAETLNITQSAVSQQMRLLTRHLNFPLFRRQSNNLVLTYEGEALAKTVSDAIRLIDEEISRLSTHDGIPDLRIGVDPSFAMGWLLPKLDRFEARLMDTKVTLWDSDQSLRLEQAKSGPGVDAIVSVSESELQLVSSLPLKEDAYVCVCSPEILQRGAKNLKLKEFKREVALTLINQTDYALHSMPIKEWTDSVGLTATPDSGIEQYATVDHLLQAAVHCRGVAIVRKTLADDHLRAGRLVLAIEGAVPCGRNFSVTWLEASENRKKVHEFVDWIQEEMSDCD